MDSTISMLAHAIAYPQEVPADSCAFDFIVDGETVSARVEKGRLVLSGRLQPMEGELDLMQLTGLAVGRMMCEEAVLACDPESREAFVWQAMPVGQRTETPSLVRFFEAFLSSLDWWRARVAEGRADLRSPISQTFIRP